MFGLDLLARPPFADRHLLKDQRCDGLRTCSETEHLDRDITGYCYVQFWNEPGQLQ